MTSRGWRIDRVPSKPAELSADGRITVPLWLLRNGVHHCDLGLSLSRAEAEALHAQLGAALYGAPLTGGRRTQYGPR